jgi:hypothetical protein
MVSLEQCFQLIYKVHTNLVKTGFEIHHSEKFSTIELIKYLINQWHGEFVLDYSRVEMYVIYTKTSCTIIFLNQQHRRGKLTCAMSDQSIGEQSLVLFLCLIFVKW